MRGDYDFSEDGFKQSSCIYNLEQVARCRNLMNQSENRLLCDWAELPGVGAVSRTQLLSATAWIVASLVDSGDSKEIRSSNVNQSY